MNEFDIKAAGWDKDPMHLERSQAIVTKLFDQVPLGKDMAALEYGAGTGITSFLLKDHLKEITMMDNSVEMVRIMKEKITAAKAENLTALFFDLEKNEWKGRKFNLLITQMVLHHVNNVDDIIRKFSKMIIPGGYLAVADLYPEDGSFHGEGFAGHKGFDIGDLSVKVKKCGFTNITHQKCFVISKKISDDKIKQYDVFLLTAKREKN